MANTEQELNSEITSPAAEVAASAPKRRGRPPKKAVEAPVIATETAAVEAVAAAEHIEEAPVKAKASRPRKKAVEAVENADAVQTVPPTVEPEISVKESPAAPVLAAEVAAAPAPARLIPPASIC